MWCSTCQQDVPAIGQPASGKLHCPRCNKVLRPPHAVKLCDDGIELDHEPAITVVRDSPPLVADDWQLRRRSRELGRKLRIEPGTPRTISHAQSELRAADHANQTSGVFQEFEKLTASPIVEPASHSEPRRSPSPQPEGGQFLAWFVTLGGIVALAGGIGSLAWIIAHDAGIWWNHALALTLAGQGLLILGLALVVTRLWRNSRHASGKLQAVHADLAQLQRTADAISAMRAGGAPAFYADLVRGASPQMLLTNLKGQIDQLSSRLGGEI